MGVTFLPIIFSIYLTFLNNSTILKFVLTKLYTDGREDIHRKNRELEINRFGTAALPFYVILSYDDKVIDTFPGMDPNKENFINFLSKAYSKLYE